MLRATRDGVFAIRDEYIWRVEDDPRGKANMNPVLFISDDGFSFLGSCGIRAVCSHGNIAKEAQRKTLPMVLNPAWDTAGSGRCGIGRDVSNWRGETHLKTANMAILNICFRQVSYEMRADGTVDFKAANPIKEVDEEVLAKIHPPTAGTLGMSVRGDLLDAKAGKRLTPALLWHWCLSR